VTLRAATDRRLQQAWIEYHPEPAQVTTIAMTAPLATAGIFEALAATAAGQSIWDRVPADLDPDGRSLCARFYPGVSGTFSLCFLDESGMANHRVFDLGVYPDPSPTVSLELPSRARPRLEVLSGANVTLLVRAEDPKFGLRTVYLEYRCRREDPPRRQALFSTPAAWLGGDVAGSAPMHMQIERRLALSSIKHLDSKDLEEGDVLTIQAKADDFDNVAVHKKPGYSPEIELHIIGRAEFELGLNEGQKRLQQALTQVRKLQQEALVEVSATERNRRQTGKLSQGDVDRLLRAEGLQARIRDAIGSKGEGLGGD
jgi:hypothetical protein